MKNYILKGCFTKFNYKHNGRIYPESAFRNYLKISLRKSKIKRLFF